MAPKSYQREENKPDTDAINPDYHAVNMVTMKTHSPPRRGGEHKESWVLLAQVEHKLAALMFQTAHTAATRVPRGYEDPTWTVVQCQPCLIASPLRHLCQATPPYATPTRR